MLENDIKLIVFAHYLVGDGTLDDILYPYLLKKVTNVSSFVEGKTSTLEVERLEKGQKGKVSKGDDSLTLSRRPEAFEKILFKYEPKHGEHA